MEKNIYNFKNKIYLNNNSLLLDITRELKQIITYINNNLITKKIEEIINKINFIINENKKNIDLIIKQNSSLHNQINNQFYESKINNNDNQKLKCENGIYIGQVVNWKREGKVFII